MQRSTALVLSATLLLSACGSSAAEDGLVPATEAVVTVPVDGLVPATEAVVTIPDENELDEASVDEANSLVETQARLQNFAQEAQSIPGIVDFRFTPDGLSGQLLVEQGVNAQEVLPTLQEHPEIEVVESMLSPQQQTDAVAAIEAIVNPITASAPSEPYFDGFEGEFIVPVDSDSIDPFSLSEELTLAAVEATGNPDVYVTVPEPNDEQPAILEISD